MITKIRVDGFRSLSEFEMKIRPGLNILVGPNGSGKTNIILFFEFLSHLCNKDLSEAISKSGGAGAIFKKESATKYCPSMHATIYGCSKMDADIIPFYRTNKKLLNTKYLIYEYSFKIEILAGGNVILFKEQRLKIGKSKTFLPNPEESIDKIKAFIDIRETANSKNDACDYKIEKISPWIKLNTFGDKTRETPTRQIERHLNIMKSTSTSLLEQTQRIFRFSNLPIEGIVSDFRGGETFNIVPSKIKLPEDMADVPGIQKDGSGLAATLNAMKKDYRHLRLIHRHDISERVYTESTFMDVVRYVKLANDSIYDIQVSDDPFNNQIVVKIVIDYGKSMATLPLSLMSDGTIKWITLITAILTSQKIFSIEEPENYLHPWMQTEIIKIMRNTFSKKKERFILMSTHSESLLNGAKPEEVIVVSMKDGDTESARVKNAKQLNKSIKESGFGLGYFYLSNALENE